jgi:hypothetical protein
MELHEITITPDMAEKMLQYNICNRPLSKSIVTNYSNMMKKGEWYFSHQAIAFSEDDNSKLILVDGQHRLAAVVLSGITTKFSVIYKAIQTPYIDTARNRTFIDNLNIFNNTTRYTKTMMGILNLLMSISKIRNTTQAGRQNFCDHYYEIFLAVDNIYKSSKTKSGGFPLRTALFIAVNLNQHKVNLKEKLENYIFIFNTGNLSIDDEYGEYVKDMRDHYYVLNREFSGISTSNSAAFKRKKLTSIFLYSIECYINNNRYISSIDMEDRLYKKTEKIMETIK